jgi:hypothetical protein
MASISHHTPLSAPRTELSSVERGLLALPMLGGIVFGLLPLFLPNVLAALTGTPGNDPYIYWLAGAATFGYAVALGIGLRLGVWAPLRLVVAAVLVFNLASLYACAAEIAGGQAQPLVYLILVASLGFIAISATLLRRHGAQLQAAPDTAPWMVWFLWIATLLATTFGLLALFVPYLFGTTFGFQATDLFLYRQGGAATLGYAAMGVMELRSRRWEELRLPAIMAGTFNGISFVASVVAIATGQGSWLAYPVGLAALGVTVGCIIALRRQGR